MPSAPVAPSALALALAVPPDRCAAYVVALGSAIGRDEAMLAELRRLDGQSRSGGRGQGLEWAIDEASQTIALLRELDEVIRALAPCLPDLRRAAGLAT